ncbi:hypothetical protein Rsub_04075 [Raphidocelis subcapitata]|uniref:Uncharacterized protein n=1 Tax=Raphidocelis subcapitata TaxID=307507 RepID=A0A2V0NVW3_9CHLO|nr:hypothetical protein Rsub_04075 [Raphidocelis subcapitata]|eukprot:GBF91771.1 hypothetical protein Rsub_04075 [Raphidocelis subcapitata]
MTEDAEEKPWKRRQREIREQLDAAEAAARLQAESLEQSRAAPLLVDGGSGDGPTELQQQLVAWYRNTFLVTGAALIGSVWRWNFGGKPQSAEVFVPPRAASLPAEVVEGWRRSMRFKEGVRTVGRQTVFATGVAALYFGAELAALRWRGREDWSNTAVGGLAAGGYLGTLLPGPSRARGAALGAVLGGALGAASGLAQQQLAERAAAAAAALGAPGGEQQQQQQERKWE